MKLVREEDAKLRAKQIAAYVPEPLEHKPLATFEIGRYTKGQFRGLFIVTQLTLEDPAGKPLKKPLRKVIAEGVDLVITLSSLETALRKRVFK